MKKLGREGEAHKPNVEGLPPFRNRNRGGGQQKTEIRNKNKNQKKINYKKKNSLLIETSIENQKKKRNREQKTHFL